MDVLWDGLAAAELLRALSPLHASAIEASLSGRARLQGGFAPAAEVRLSVQLSETALRVGDLELQLQQASVELERGRLHSEGRRPSTPPYHFAGVSITRLDRRTS